MKPALAVKPVPVVDFVQRKEKVINGLHDRSPAIGHAPPIGRVKRTHHRSRKRETRRVKRNTLAALGLRNQPAAGFRLLKNAAAHGHVTRGGVDPAYGIRGRRGIQKRQKLVPAVHAPLGHDHHVALGLQQLHFGAGYRPGLAKPANRCLEKPGVFFRGKNLDALWRHQRDFGHVAAERPRAMVVLAVHIHRNRAADGGKAGPRHHRGQPSLRRENLQ